MEDLLNSLLKQVGPAEILAISNQIGASEEQTADALGGILPTVLGAMTNNTKTPEGASGLLVALESDHDGSILDNVVGFIGTASSSPGNGILSHILGGQRSSVEKGLSSKTGLSSSQISNLLQIVAPIVMGYLGRQKRQSSSDFNVSTISQLLGGMTRQADKSTGMDLGDILDIVGNFSGEQSQQSSGIGGLLGKLFR